MTTVTKTTATAQSQQAVQPVQTQAVQKNPTMDMATALDKACESGLMAFEQAGTFARTFMAAQAVYEIKSLLTPKVMETVMALQNTSIGFKTDQPQTGYRMEIVRDCIIDAAMNGVYPVGNEFNIIAGNMYITKKGFCRKLKAVKGLRYSITPSLPKFYDTGATITMLVEWNYNGEDGKRELPLAIRMNKGQGADAIIGKATRKASAWLWTNITGQEISDGEVGDVVDVSTPQAQKPTTSPFEMDETGQATKPAENEK